MTRELLEAAEWPFIIDGLTHNWTNLQGWTREAILQEHAADPFHLHDTYNKSLGELLVIDGKYHMGHAVYPAHACYSDPWRPYSPFLFDQVLLLPSGRPSERPQRHRPLMHCRQLH